MKYIHKLTFDEFLQTNNKALEVLTINPNKTTEAIFNDKVSYGLVYEFTAIIQSKPFSIEECESNPQSIYVFDDNIIKQDNDGPRIIRNCANSFGLITKRFPSTFLDSYLIDNIINMDTILSNLNNLFNLYTLGKPIVFQPDYLGSEVNEFQKHAPKLFRLINEFIQLNFFNKGQ